MATQTAQNKLREKLHQGLVHQKAGALAEARKCYKQVLKKVPDNADALHLLGVTCRQLGQPKQALEYIQKAIRVDPNQSIFYANLARAMMDLGTDPDSLLLVVEKSLELNPHEREARNMKAIALTRLKRFAEAEVILQKLIVEDPEKADAYNNYAQLLMDAGQAQHAVNLFTKAIMIDPTNVHNFIQRSRLRLKLKQFEPSQYELTEALERFPENADVYHEAARLLFSMNETPKGVFYAQKALDLDPRDYHKNVTLGVNLLMNGDPAGALAAFTKAKDLAPEGEGTVLWNQSLAYLALGDLQMGWDLHPYRFADPASTVLRRKFEVPIWQGEDICDKTILIWADQGLGDALKSGTMIPDLLPRAKKVIVEGSEKGAKFFRHSFPEAECRVAQTDAKGNATASDFDVQINMTDLAQYFRRDVKDFEEAPCPVYSFERERAVSYLNRLEGHNEKPVIGFSWRSKNLAPHRAKYYLSAPGIAPLVNSRDAIFVNLQYATVAKEIAFFKEKFPEKFHFLEDVDLFDDLLGAAALTACCDIVVSANTSVADMAGILNVPAIRFGPQEPALLLGQDNPPWYPAMRYLYSFNDRPCAEFVPEIIKELDRQLENWTPERRNSRLGL